MDVKSRILLEDEHFIVVNKPALIPTQPDTTGDDSLKDFVEQYLNQSVHIVHRLDRVASGVVLLAKSKQAAEAATKLIQLRGVQKTYVAVVENRPPEDSAALVHFLIKNSKTNTAKAFNENKNGAKRAELSYQLRGSSDRYFLLEIDLKTGRFHQIRAQLSAIGCSIKGDVKYGARRNNPDRAIHLHAWKLSFIHPFNKKQIDIEATPPDEVLWNYFFHLLK